MIEGDEMGDIGSKLRVPRSGGARRPIIGALLLLAVVSFGGTAGWSQSDGSITTITGGSSGGAPANSSSTTWSPASAAPSVTPVKPLKDDASSVTIVTGA